MTQPSQLFPGYRPRKVEDSVLYETVAERGPHLRSNGVLGGSTTNVLRRRVILAVIGFLAGLYTKQPRSYWIGFIGALVASALAFALYNGTNGAMRGLVLRLFDESALKVLPVLFGLAYLWIVPLGLLLVCWVPARKRGGLDTRVGRATRAVAAALGLLAVVSACLVIASNLVPSRPLSTSQDRRASDGWVERSLEELSVRFPEPPTRRTKPLWVGSGQTVVVGGPQHTSWVLEGPSVSFLAGVLTVPTDRSQWENVLQGTLLGALGEATMTGEERLEGPGWVGIDATFKEPPKAGRIRVMISELGVYTALVEVSDADALQRPDVQKFFASLFLEPVGPTPATEPDSEAEL